MLSARSTRGCDAGSASSKSSQFDAITVIELLKSCAMPPASRPTDSIFCVCRSCVSSSRRSVKSSATPATRITVPSGPRTGNAWSRIHRTAPSGRRMRYSSS